MRIRQEKKLIAVLFVVPLLTLASVPLRTIVNAAVRKNRTEALVRYTQINACGDSSTSCYSEEIDWLIDNGADPNARMPDGSPIARWWAKHQGVHIAQHLQRVGARPDTETQRLIWRAYKNTLSDSLMSAIDSESITWLQKAIGAGADVNYTDDTGYTPLAKAVEGRFLAGVRFLISKGAKARTKYEGVSLLSLALENGGDIQMLSLLQKSGAPTTPTIELFLAVINNRPNEVRRWLRAGINVDTTNNGANDDWTPLMWAASYGYVKMVRLLLRYGADPTIRDSDGWTALKCAQRGDAKGETRTSLITMLKTATHTKKANHI